MQIFATSADPDECAKSLDNVRLDKMITESAQIICTVLADDGVKNLPFKPTHQHHPLVKWAGYSDANLWWVLRHHVSLHGEWTFRFDKLHASGLSLEITESIRMSAKAPQTFLNMAKNTLRELDFAWIEDVHLAYQMYLTARWMNDTRIPSWGKRKMPSWFKDVVCEDHTLLMIYVNRAKALIGNKKDGIIACPRCGNDLSYKDSRHFKCKGEHAWYPCLLWIEIPE